MRQIATELGMSPTAAYRYFRNKDEILAAVRAAAFNRFCETIEATTGASTDVRKSARSVGQAYLEFALANPDAYRMMFDVGQDSVAIHPDLAEALARADRCMVDYVVPLAERSILRGDPKVLGRMLWAAAHGLVMLRLSGIVSSDAELRELHRNTMSALVRGSHAMGSAKTSGPSSRKLGLVSQASSAAEISPPSPKSRSATTRSA